MSSSSTLPLKEATPRRTSQPYQYSALPLPSESGEAYNEESPLADGWQDRIGLHQLHMLIVHCWLFGGGYVDQTLAIARRWV